MNFEIQFSERLTVQVPAEFRDAVRLTAQRAGLTVADLTRAALSERMARDGVAHFELPALSSTTERQPRGAGGR